MKTTARILITQQCNRNCSGCCNTYKTVMNTAKHISNLNDMNKYDEIIITGGEPMLKVNRTILIIKQIKKINPKAKIYLYTALFREEMHDIIKLVDGIQISLHAEADCEDVVGFEKFEHMALDYYHDKTFRAYIEPKVAHRLFINPKVWTRLEIKPWMEEGNCPLPSHEELFILSEEYNV